MKKKMRRRNARGERGHVRDESWSGNPEKGDLNDGSRETRETRRTIGATKETEAKGETKDKKRKEKLFYAKPNGNQRGGHDGTDKRKTQNKRRKERH